jgi:high-affinity nickel-transport protein
MTLIDTTDSILMLGAYGWAFIEPIRKLCYNLTITIVSVVVAVGVGGLEALNLVGAQLGLAAGGGVWAGIGALNSHFDIVGFAIVTLFLGAWLLSFVVYRVKRYDEIAASL